MNERLKDDIMLPQRKTKNAKPVGRLIPERKSTVKVAATLWVTAAFVVLMALGASAKDALLHGHVVTVNQNHTKWTPGAKAAADA
jgi:hypothetical protein